VLGFYFSALTLWDSSMQEVPNVARHFLLVPIGLVIQAVPLFPGGAGIGEAGFGWLYTVFGTALAAPLGVLASLVFRVTTWVFAIGGFFVAQRMTPVTVREPEPEPEQEPASGAGPILHQPCESSATV
jgi:hypothetical protein